jgi:uncharacterized membrane protein YeaQ/YmgE (transglycosylase-associated protein family)
LSFEGGIMPLTFILLFLFALLFGWLASVILRANTPRELLGLLLTSLAGALVGAFMITPPFAGRIAWIGFSLPGLLFSLFGSVLLLVVAGALTKAVAARSHAPRPPRA